MDVQPLAGDDFQSLLTVLPSVIRGPEGRLRVKGGTPTTGALQLSSASLNDPSTGDFDLELPSGAVESVEVLSNPFAAEYGRFSTSVTQVRTKRGTQRVDLQARQPDAGVRQGSLHQQVRAAAVDLRAAQARPPAVRPVPAVPLRPHAGRRACQANPTSASTASTRSPASTRCCRRVTRLTGGVIYFPRKITNATLSTFRPTEDDAEVHAGRLRRRRRRSPDPLRPHGARVDLRGSVRSRSTRRPRAIGRWSTRRRGRAATSSTARSGNVHSLQIVEALTISKDLVGQHVFKFGVDLQRSGFDGDNYSQQVDVVRLDGSLAERTTFAPAAHASRRQRHRVRAVRAGPLARQRPADVRARLPHRSRRRRRRRQLLAAGRGRAQPAARGPRHPARRLRQVRASARRSPSAPSPSCRWRTTTRYGRRRTAARRRR